MNIDLFVKYCKVLSNCAHKNLIYKISNDLRIEYIYDSIKKFNGNQIDCTLGTDNDVFLISVFIEADVDGYYACPCTYCFEDDKIKLFINGSKVNIIDSKEDLFNLSLQYDNLVFSYEDLLKIQEENRKHDFKIDMYFTVGEEKYAIDG